MEEIVIESEGVGAWALLGTHEFRDGCADQNRSGKANTAGAIAQIRYCEAIRDAPRPMTFVQSRVTGCAMESKMGPDSEGGPFKGIAARAEFAGTHECLLEAGAKLGEITWKCR